MDEQESKFINLITHLPPNVNPYLAAANALEVAVHSPPSPLWARHLRVVLLILEELMLFQSLFLLYQRLRISKSLKIKRNSLGLVIVNMSYIAAFIYSSYSISTIYTLIVQIAMDWGRRVDEAMMLLVFGLRFFTVFVGSWAFLWVCACQCAFILWNSKLASKMDTEHLRKLIQWGTSSLILIFAFAPLPGITWQYVKAYQDLHQIESIAHHLSATLRSQAESYDSDNFNQLSLLSSLLPAKKILPLQDHLETSLRLGQKLYLMYLGLLSIVYVPLLTTSLRSLFQQSKLQQEIDAATEPKQDDISRKIRRQRQRLVFHAISAYFATSIHLPVVIYEVILSRAPGFTQSVRWNLLTFLGLTAPLSLTGNIALAVLNLHSYLILRDRTRPRMQNMSTSNPQADPSDVNIFQKGVNFALAFNRWSPEVTMQLEDLESCENGHLQQPPKSQ